MSHRTAAMYATNQMGQRGEQTLNVTYYQLSSGVMTVIDPKRKHKSPLAATTFWFNKSKVNQRGNIELVGGIRNIDVRRCQIGALARYFVYMFAVHKEPKLDFFNKDAMWTRRQMFPGRNSLEEPLCDHQARDEIGKAQEGAGIRSRHRMHAGRHTHSQVSQAFGVGMLDLFQAQHRSAVGAYATYGSKLPIDTMLAVAGVMADIPYHCPRAGPLPPDCVVRAVIKWLPADLERLRIAVRTSGGRDDPNGNIDNALAAAEQLEYFVVCFLQDAAAGLMDMCKPGQLYSLPALHMREFREYKVHMQAHIKAETEKFELERKASNPAGAVLAMYELIESARKEERASLPATTPLPTQRTLPSTPDEPCAPPPPAWYTYVLSACTTVDNVITQWYDNNGPDWDKTPSIQAANHMWGNTWYLQANCEGAAQRSSYQRKKKLIDWLGEYARKNLTGGAEPTRAHINEAGSRLQAYMRENKFTLRNLADKFTKGPVLGVSPPRERKQKRVS